MAKNTRLATTVTARYMANDSVADCFYLDGRMNGRREEHFADITLDREDRGSFLALYASPHDPGHVNGVSGRELLDQLSKDLKENNRKKIDQAINDLAECAVGVTGRLTLADTYEQQPYFGGVIVKDGEIAAVTLGRACAYLYRDDALFPLTQDDIGLEAVDYYGKSLPNIDDFSAGVAGTLRYSNIAQLKPNDCILICNRELMEIIGQKRMLQLLDQAEDQCDAAGMAMGLATHENRQASLQFMIAFVEDLIPLDRLGRSTLARGFARLSRETAPLTKPTPEAQARAGGSGLFANFDRTDQWKREEPVAPVAAAPAVPVSASIPSASPVPAPLPVASAETDDDVADSVLRSQPLPALENSAAENSAAVGTEVLSEPGNAAEGASEQQGVSEAFPLFAEAIQDVDGGAATMPNFDSSHLELESTAADSETAAVEEGPFEADTAEAVSDTAVPMSAVSGETQQEADLLEDRMPTLQASAGAPKAGKGAASRGMNLKSDIKSDMTSADRGKRIALIVLVLVALILGAFIIYSLLKPDSKEDPSGSIPSQNNVFNPESKPSIDVKPSPSGTPEASASAPAEPPEVAVISEPTGAAPKEEGSGDGSPTLASTFEYKVQKGDTALGIIKRIYHVGDSEAWDLYVELSGSDTGLSDDLLPGDVLRLPKAAGNTGSN